MHKEALFIISFHAAKEFHRMVPQRTPLRLNLAIAEACYCRPESFEDAYQEVHLRCSTIILGLSALHGELTQDKILTEQAQHLLTEIYSLGGWGIEKDLKKSRILKNSEPFSPEFIQEICKPLYTADPIENIAALFQH
jgi:hypothetical protein